MKDKPDKGEKDGNKMPGDKPDCIGLGQRQRK